MSVHRSQQGKTNVQVVQEIMNYSAHGALAQAFVMEAIAQYSSMVIKNPPPDDPNAIIPSDVWVKVAEEVQGKLQKHYGDKGDSTKIEVTG